MTTYISILRGINVGAHNPIKMDALLKLFAGLGFLKVQTYIQIGNIIYQSKKSGTQNISDLIKKNIQQKFGLDVPVITLTLDELTAIIKSNPFSKDKTKNASFLHVTFLSDKPGNDDINKIEEIDFSSDKLKIIGKAVYLYCPNGYAKTKLSNSFFEKKLKTTATTRNWKITNDLVNIAKEIKEDQS